MKISAFLTIFSLSCWGAFSSGAGQWSPRAIESLSSISDPIGKAPPDLTTLWGGVKRFFKGEALEGDEFSLSLEGFEKKLEVYAHVAKNRDGKVKKAPLMIFFPGIFGTHRGNISPWLLNAFEKEGFHTVVVPNFLSRAYISANPRYTEKNALDFDPEAAWKSAGKVFSAVVGVENIEKVALVGESLGSYLLARMAEQYGEQEVFAGKTVKVFFLWPPLNVKKSLSAFDAKNEATKQTYEDCVYWTKLPSFLLNFWWRESPDKLTKKESKCFGAYLFHGAFLKSMKKSFESFKEAKDMKTAKEPAGFREFVKMYNPFFDKALESSDPRLELGYWVKQWKRHNVPVRIASSVDDFINDPRDWREIKDKFLFDWGEHCAPVASNRFMEILVKEAK